MEENLEALNMPFMIIRVSKPSSAGLWTCKSRILWQSAWQGRLSLPNLERWICSNVSGEVVGDPAVYLSGICLSGKKSQHFCKIFIYWFSLAQSYVYINK